MKKIILALLCLLPVNAHALDFGGGGVIPPCTATPPAQAATSAGAMATLTYCDTLATNQHVDVGNTELPGYLFYVCEPDTTSGYSCSIPANYTNDGTGLANQKTISVSNQYQLLTVGKSAASPYYVGTPLKGVSFYAEIEQKFSRTKPTANAGWPALWGGEAIYSLNGAYVPANFPFMEIDWMECYDGGGQGDTCAPNQQLHVWYHTSGNNAANSCSFAGGYNPAHTFPVNPTSYHTYGVRFLMPGDNNGVIEIDFYTDNVLINACTETAGSGVVSCTYSNSATGSNGGYGASCGVNTTTDLTPMETTDFTFIMGGAYQWPVTLRNFHVWTK